MSSISSILTSATATPTADEDPEITTTIISTVLPTTTIYDRDPYLDYQPAFAYSLPMQFLLTGVILSLSTILLIHLVFTAPYHWPLAKFNYSLQMASVISLLLSLGITLSVILGSVLATSREWPYMLNYVAVDIPLQNWTQLENGWWYTLDAITSGLAHASCFFSFWLGVPFLPFGFFSCHMIGPLVLLSSLSSFVTLSPSANTRSVADSIKNACNSALAILFSLALWAWGLIINRKEAWRTDGGTAIFGGGALALSLVSIALNLYQIVKVPPVWVPPLLWAIVLWQSFLGWWWYVGSATPEPHSRPHSKGKKRSKAQNGETARLAKVRNRLGLSDGLRQRRPGEDGDFSTELRRTTTSERESTLQNSPRSSTYAPPKSPVPQQNPGRLAAYIPSPILSWWNRLRLEHVNARQQQAAENEQRRFEVYGHIDETGAQTIRGVPGSGWGLGSFALAGHRRAAAAAARPPTDDEAGFEEDVEGAFEMGTVAPTSPWGEEDRRVPQVQRQQLRPAAREELSRPSTSWSWMGPFRRWRLRDATVY
ncbi:hypothetical protein M408DRAFT_328116 [Serendipita vermifera MAFF 305830]|uniref:Uncharacterized protein n=1 Tax=Serendipita vermifera MAFF 305830 TaxID=933852 RepID=A0A0C2XNL2_SERVB|nr:hypothetical protein M408DRAFT_328116 [Serendipita vermifera MAFF 305830]